jgi:hypothetical protein
MLARLRELALVDSTAVAELAVLPEEDPRRLADRLVWAGRLTAWQADCLLNDRIDGLRFGPWVLVDRLSVEGESERFRARPADGGPEALLSRWPVGRLERPGAAERLGRETQAASLLRHPNLAGLREAGQCEGRPFTARDWPGGCDLATRLRQSGPLPAPFATDCVRQAALGLHQAHQAGLVHRDLRAGTVFVSGLTPAGPLPVPPVVVLAGLGESALLTDLPGLPAGTAAGLTLPTRAEIQADLTALGGLLYDLLAGPAPGRPLVRLPAGLPQGLAAFTARLLDERADGRPATAAAVADALAAYPGPAAPDSAIPIGVAPPLAEGVSFVSGGSAALAVPASDIFARPAVPVAESASGILAGSAAPPLAEGISFVAGNSDRLALGESLPLAEGVSFVGTPPLAEGVSFVARGEVPESPPPLPVAAPLPVVEMPALPTADGPPPLPVWDASGATVPDAGPELPDEHAEAGLDLNTLAGPAGPSVRAPVEDDDVGRSWLLYTVGGLLLHGTAVVLLAAFFLGWFNWGSSTGTTSSTGSPVKPVKKPRN